MSEPLKIIFAISEMEGLAKTGGLADVGKALPLALKRRGHDVRIVLPHYQSIAEDVHTNRVIQTLGVPMGGTEIWCAVNQVMIEGIPVYFIEHHGYFFRERFYDDGFQEYGDNAARFGFFSKAVLQLCKALHFAPDILHCHDWQTAMLPYYHKVYEADHPLFQNSASIMTIHNAAFQGNFSGDFQGLLGIQPQHFVMEHFEDYGQINFLKGGISWADKTNAVSPGYADELLTPLGSHGLYEVFDRRKADLSGIVNGCDYQDWNPEIDPMIPANYSVEDLSGKQLCKQALQKRFYLPERPEVPLMGIVSRLTQQKGFGYLIPALYTIMQWEVQLVVLGTGETWIEQEFYNLARNFPDKVEWHGTYDWELSHWIEAGSDMFLMPSLYEPCGLNQLYSLRYGTLPVVRAVGGLRDTVENYDAKNISGTGFMFDEPTVEDVIDCISWAVKTYYDRPEHFQQLVRNAMGVQFEWDQSAIEYENMYEAALKKA